MGGLGGWGYGFGAGRFAEITDVDIHYKLEFFKEQKGKTLPNVISTKKEFSKWTALGWNGQPKPMKAKRFQVIAKPEVTGDGFTLFAGGKTFNDLNKLKQSKRAPELRAKRSRRRLI